MYVSNTKGLSLKRITIDRFRDKMGDYVFICLYQLSDCFSQFGLLHCKKSSHIIRTGLLLPKRNGFIIQKQKKKG